ESYSRVFCAFMDRVRPRYAVPFASNHCHLHKDTWEYNRQIVAPGAVSHAFERYKLEHPFATELKIMTSGDSWDSSTGFSITPSPWLEDRDRQLAAYLEAKQSSLERTYHREARVRISEDVVRRRLLEIAAAVPFFWRIRFRGHPVL